MWESVSSTTPAKRPLIQVWHAAQLLLQRIFLGDYLVGHTYPSDNTIRIDEHPTRASGTVGGVLMYVHVYELWLQRRGTVVPAYGSLSEVSPKRCNTCRRESDGESTSQSDPSGLSRPSASCTLQHITWSELILAWPKGMLTQVSRSSVAVKSTSVCYSAA